jgi:hypothetical protein
MRVEDPRPPITVRPMGCIIMEDSPGKKAMVISPSIVVNPMVEFITYG